MYPVQEINEPVKVYRESLKFSFRERAIGVFDELVRKSQIDVAAQTKLSELIRKQEKEIAQATDKLNVWKSYRALCVVLIVLIPLLVFGYYLSSPEVQNQPFFPKFILFLLGTLPPLGFLWVIISCLLPRILNIQEFLAHNTEICRGYIAQAQAELSPLYRLFQWNTVTNIFSEICPIISFDPYFNQDRFSELSNQYHWKHGSNQNNSVLFCQSGAINECPYILGERFLFEWGTQIYTGQLEISWTESEHYTDSDGKRRMRTVTRYQTLWASLTKPKPFYRKEKFLEYGNEAAPDLTFSHTPEEEVSMGEIIRETRKDGTDFTIMLNEEFELLFHALNRNDERQFRLLFTPLAQQEMVNLLKDKTEGFGDQFTFQKDKMINRIQSKPLDQFNITASPHLFEDYDLEKLKSHFLEYSQEYFRTLFFTFAPLLTIPLYQQHRSLPETLFRKKSKRSSFWEHEAIANSFDPGIFEDITFTTPSILKTKILSQDKDGTQVEVTAHSFSQIKHTESIRKRGGDGYNHEVPVTWIEYVPVSKETDLVILETDESDKNQFEEKFFQSSQWKRISEKWGTPDSDLHFRKSIAYFISTHS